MKKISHLFLMLFPILFIFTACQAKVARDEDGSLVVETTISQQELQQVISDAIDDPLVTQVTVSLQSGYMLVSGERQRQNNPGKTDTLSFRLDLSANNGKLAASISNVQIDNFTIKQDRIDNWNQSIANLLYESSQSSNNAALKSVSITPQAVTMVWSEKK